jgi:virulence factor Mce-like protein
MSRGKRKLRKDRKGLPPFAVGLGTLLVLAMATYLGFTKAIPFRHHYTVQAVFPSANGIRPGSPVRIAGVNVGKVTSVGHVEDGKQAALVTMRVDKKGLPIHKDATMKIRPRIFLEGNFFVDVSPGSPSSPTIHDGDRIPINQTSAPVQLDQVLSALQAPTRKDLQALLRELSSGLKGAGAKGYNASIQYWKPAYRDGAIVADAAQGTQPGDLQRYIDKAGTTAQAIDRNREQLKSLVTDFNTTAAAFAARQSELSDAVGELPHTLQAAMPAFGALNASFPAVRGLIRAARPAVRSSGPAIDAAMPFTRQARGLVSKPELRGLSHDLRPLVPALTTLNQASTPLFGQVSQASNCQNDVILPWSKDKIDDSTFPARGPVYEEATKPLPGLAGESRSGDANGQWFRVMLTTPKLAYPMGTDKFFLTGQPIQGVNPPTPKNHARPPLRSDVPCETQQPPDLRTHVGAAPQGFELNQPTAAAKTAALQKTVDWLRKDLKDQGSSLKVSDVPATLKELQK